MQLCHTHRQLLSRCTLRWYSVGTSSDTVATSDVQVPTPRLKRPLASTFGGINIQNVVVPTKSASHNFGNKAKRPLRSNGSNDQSPDVRRMGQTERKKEMGRGGASSSWGDGLVSLSFSNRLKQRQYKPITRGGDTEPRPQEAQSRKQNSYHAQHPQTHGHRRGQKQQEHDDAPQTHRRGKTENRKSATTSSAVQQRNRTSAPAPSTNSENNELKASSMMTRPSSRHPNSTAATAPKTTKADTASRPSPSNAPATEQPKSASSDRKAILATLSSTNLNALFRTTTTNTPTPVISIPSLPASTTASASNSASARVRSVLERSAGDYSRFLPRGVGARKDASRLPALRAARQALATQRDLSLKQRRAALHIIEGLVQPRREVRAS